MKYLLLVVGLPGSGKSSIVKPIPTAYSGPTFVPAIQELAPTLRPNQVVVLDDPRLSDIATALSGKKQGLFCTSPNFCIPDQLERTLQFVQSMGKPIAARALFIKPDLKQSEINLKNRVLAGGANVSNRTLDRFDNQYDIPKLTKIFKSFYPKTLYREVPTFQTTWPAASPAAQLTHNAVTKNGVAVEALTSMPDWPRGNPVHAEPFFIHQTYACHEEQNDIDGNVILSEHNDPPDEFVGFPEVGLVAKALAPDVTQAHIDQIAKTQVKEVTFYNDDPYSHYEYISKYADIRDIASWLVDKDYKVEALKDVLQSPLIVIPEPELESEITLD